MIIPAWNGRGYLPACLDALLVQEGPSFEIVVVDNASADGTADLVEQDYPQVRLIRNPHNLGFAGACNVGARAATGELLVFVNQDVVPRPGWLAALLSPLQRPTVGAVGCKLLFPDGRTIQHAGGVLPYPLALAAHLGHRELDQGQWDGEREVDFVTGAALATTRSHWEETGGFDEGFFPGYFEDSDLCVRLRGAGYGILYLSDATAIHHESTSTRRDSFPYFKAFHRSRLRFVLKHYSAAQFLGDFVPAEGQRLGDVAARRELQALQVAYYETIVALPSICGWEGDAFGRAVVALEELGARAAQQWARAVESLAQWSGVMDRSDPYVGALADRHRIEERPFTSRVPVLGPLIARFRELWNSVAARWTVRAVVQQQNEFNEAVVQNVLNLGARLDLAETRLASLTRHLADRSPAPHDSGSETAAADGKTAEERQDV